MEFTGFPKMARLSREVIITEKIDGTNAQIVITLASDAQKAGHIVNPYIACVGDYVICAGSRTRWITPQDDNFGFAKWVVQNAESLVNLGEGKHFGEWYGKGIQRGYGLNDKRFALFNASRWNAENAPDCCQVVPVLYSGLFDTNIVNDVIEDLRVNGSKMVQGFMRPEGIIVYHIAAGVGFKKTLDNDEMPKSLAA